MNEESPSESVSQAAQSVTAEAPRSAGRLLKQARENAGLHIAALAVSLKVPVRRLEALEAERWDQLPDPVFVRGLASSVCRALKLDPAEVLRLLPQTAVPQLKPDAWGINAPFREPGSAPKEPVFAQLSRPVILSALALLAGALVIIFFPSMEGPSKPSAAVTSDVVVPLSVTPTIVEAPSPEPAGAAAAVPSATPSPAPSSPVAVQSAPAQLPANPVSPAASTSATPATPGSQSVAPPAVASTGPVVFRMRGASWVEVVDAKGVVQLRRIVQTGETLGVSGDLPLSVVVGRADVTDVQVKGKPFSLDAIARDNVARFEVK